jgi:hypothetical protein
MIVLPCEVMVADSNPPYILIIRSGSNTIRGQKKIDEYPYNYVYLKNIYIYFVLLKKINFYSPKSKSESAPLTITVSVLRPLQWYHWCIYGWCNRLLNFTTINWNGSFVFPDCVRRALNFSCIFYSVLVSVVFSLEFFLYNFWRWIACSLLNGFN